MLAVIACALWLCGPKKPLSHPIDPVIISTQPVVFEDSYEVERRFVGVVEPAQESALGFEREGLINFFFVKEGTYVTKGQEIASLDTARLEAQIKELQAQMQVADAELSIAELTLDRVETAYETESVSSQEMDQALATYEGKLAAIEAYEAGIDRLELELKKSTLVAPFSGVITKRVVDSGMAVSAGSPVVVLEEDATNKIRVGLPGNLSEKYQLNDEVELQINDQVIRAVIDAILPLRDPHTRTIDMLLLPSKPVRTGDLVTLKYPVTINQEGYWLPLTALTESIRGLWAVYVPVESQEGYRVESRLVEILHQEGDRVFVRGLLEPGERIVKNGAFKLVPGQIVRLKNELIKS